MLGWSRATGSSCAAEAAHACRYAAHELNGFPTWLLQLFEKHPKPVSDLLLQDIWYELSIEKPDTDTHYILNDVSWTGEWAWNEIEPRLLEFLRTTEPSNLTNLRKLLTIVQGSSVSGVQIRTLATKKSRRFAAIRILPFGTQFGKALIQRLQFPPLPLVSRSFRSRTNAPRSP
jgi:hypothetical protein